MLPQETLGQVTTPDGQQLVLYRRAGVFTIRVNGYELMSSRAHGSEEALARLGCSGLNQRPQPRVLIAGLGMGYTVRAALHSLPPNATVVVGEVFSAVVEWCQGPLAHLAGNVLADRRVRVVVDDVQALLRCPGKPYDAILLDVDNGPDALTLASNKSLYGPAGLARIHRALTRTGVLAVWSAARDRGFQRRLGKAGFTVRCETVRATATRKGPAHTIFLAKRQNQPRRQA